MIASLMILGCGTESNQPANTKSEYADSTILRLEECSHAPTMDGEGCQTIETDVSCTTVELRDDEGNLVVTSETDGVGNLSFQGLEAGASYHVTALDRNGLPLEDYEGRQQGKIEAGFNYEITMLPASNFRGSRCGTVRGTVTMMCGTEPYIVNAPWWDTTFPVFIEAVSLEGSPLGIQRLPATETGDSPFVYSSLPMGDATFKVHLVDLPEGFDTTSNEEQLATFGKGVTAESTLTIDPAVANEVPAFVVDVCAEVI